MGVPADIRQVPRPKNTIVTDNGHPGPLRYAVRARKAKDGPTARSAKGNAMPANGSVIGHIIDKVFVPLIAKASNLPASLEFGFAAWIYSVCDEIKTQLLKSFNAAEAYAILAIAFIRILWPSVADCRLSSEYEQSWVRIYFPGVPLSKNWVSNFFNRLGMDEEKRQAFYALRWASVCNEHHVAIDGTLKQDTSKVNDFSDYSHKARVKGCRDISVLYAYDVEKNEPICSYIAPGNCLDASAYRTFIRNNNIQRGVVLADKGFPPSAIKEELAERPNLHFLTPIKRNDKRIETNHMLAFEETLEYVGKTILCKKCKIQGGRYLYSYKDVRLAGAEERHYAERAQKNDSFNGEKYEKKRQTFGVIVLESDVEMTLLDAYICYANRWRIELMFRRYKGYTDFDQTREQGNFTVIGSEFVNFVATVLTGRMVEKARAVKLLEDETFESLGHTLSKTFRKVGAAMPPDINDDGWMILMPTAAKNMVALGLATDNKKAVS